MNDSGKIKPRWFVQYAKYSDLGIRFALSIVIFLFIGKWVDRQLGTMPLFLVIGVLLGATAGLISIYRAVFPPDKKHNSRNDETQH